MAYEYDRSAQRTNTDKVRTGRGVVVLFVPYTGVTAPYAGIERNGVSATENKPIGPICVLDSMDDIVMSPINERQIFGVGKNLTTVSEGQEIGEFTLQLKGNAVATLWAFANQDGVTVPAIKHKVSYTLNGALIIIGHDTTDGASTIKRSDLILDVRMKLDTIPGASDGDTTQPVTFFSDSGEVYTLEGSNTFAVEIWRDNAASITNASAPDGLLVNFVLGTGNSSGGGTPTSLVLDPNATGYKQYFPLILHNTVRPTTADLTYVNGTSTMTFGTAPADGDTILAIYAIDTSADNLPLGVTAGLDPETDVMSRWYGWEY